MHVHNMYTCAHESEKDSSLYTKKKYKKNNNNEFEKTTRSIDTRKKIVI